MRPRARRCAAAVVVLAVGCTTLWGTTAPTRAEGLTKNRRSYAVGVRTETLVDTSRSTPAQSALGIADAASRTIPVTIWYPAKTTGDTEPVADAKPVKRERFPLVVWAPGNGGKGSDAPAVAQAWARFGYVVATLDFPVSSHARSNADAAADWAAQPGDVRFVADQLLSRDRDNPLRRTVDRHRLGVAGHSLGAATVLAVGFGDTQADPRVDAVISFSGLPLLDEAAVATRPIPLLLLHGDDDPTVPLAQSQSMYESAVGPRFLVTVTGGAHSTYLEEPDPTTSKTLTTVTVAFWDAFLHGDHHAADRISPALDVPGRITVAASPVASGQERTP